MACDPTTITSAIVASPISMLGNAIKTCITDVWNLQAHVEEGRRDHQLYSPVLQNAAADPPLERVHERLQLLQDQLAGQSHSSWGLLSLFKRPIRAHDIQNTHTRLRDSVLSDGIMHLISAATSDSHSRDTLLQVIHRQYSDVRRNSHQIDRITQLLERPPAVHIMHRYSIPQVHLELSDYAVGIDDKIQRLESLLLNDAGPQLIGLFGMAGVGKSFMAALVCSRRRVKQHFRDKILWVDVSSVGCEGDVLQLQIELFSAFTGHTLMRPFASEVEGRQALCDYLAAQQERYLLVYDNVWKRSIVEPLHFELNSSDKRTNIKTMVVSRKGDLLDSSRYDWSSVKVPPLSTEDAYMLFCKHTFNGNEEAPNDMRAHVYTLVNSCYGIPKLLEVIAKYVSRDQTRMQQVGFWKHVISKLHKVEAEAEDEHDKILKMMKLNYDDLKRDVQQLFLLYATRSVYRYRDEALYYMWVALQDENQEGHEHGVMKVRYEIARATLENSFLVGMHLYLEAPLLIKELGRHIIAADKEAFIGIAERCPSVEQTMNFEVESAQVIMLSGARICSLESATQLRVLEYRGSAMDQAVQRFAFPSSLRYLSYEKRIHDADECLSRLLELRYLRLSGLTGNGIERLFMALSKLSKMEFLRLYFVEKVELNLSFLGCMPCLIILLIDAPPGSIFRNLNYENLQDLKVLRIGKDIPWWGFFLPAAIRYLHLEGLPSLVEIGSASNSSLSHLTIIDCERLSMLPSPLTSLEELTLKDVPSLVVEFGSEKFPRLRRIEISNCEKRRRDLLPRRSLGLLFLTEIPALVQIGSALQQLVLKGLPWLTNIGSASDFSVLRRLEISECERLAGLPSLPALQRLTLEGLPRLTQIGSASTCPSRFPKLFRLKISKCEELTLLEEFPVLHDLTISDCGKLARLPSLALLRHLELEASPLLVEAVSKAHFPKLHSVTISAFKKVPLRYSRYLTASHQRLDTWIYPPLWRAP